MNGFFGGGGDVGQKMKQAKDERAKEDLKQWQRQLKQEIRQQDRQIMKIRREQDKVKREIKQYAQKGETGAVKTLAKEVRMEVFGNGFFCGCGVRMDGVL